RQGVKAILATRPDLEVCCEASDGAEALEGVLKYKPDIVVLDVSMPVMSGFTVAETIALMNLQVHVLLYTMYYSEHLLREAKRVGVQGYVSKTNAARELLQAIDRLVEGKTYFGGESSNTAAQNAGRRPLVL
ncbi:MAG: response regulator transcription factor, partial [Acidobacteria bacterium]|nr:response regulator transcription factor [Acidobacteriota bacterium]